eukprot:COSAG02_NODE_15828_length_1138_cov_1.443696_1_plen_311_part_10
MRGSAKRKRGSKPSLPTDSPAARRTCTGAAAAATDPTAPAEPPTLVECEGDWATSLRVVRDEGHFLDAVLAVSGGKEIHAHKAVLIAHSPFLHGLFTSGLAESAQDRVELTDTDSAAVEAIVDCFYSGQVSLTPASVCATIRTAHTLHVGAVEKAAGEFFVSRLEPATVVPALAGFTSEFVASTTGRELHRRCVEYAQDHFADCVAERSFVESMTNAETVAEIMRGDSVTVSEQDVLTAIRAWVAHDENARSPALSTLLLCVRFPTMSDKEQLEFFSDPLFLSLWRQSEQAAAVAAKLAKECTAAFARSVE